MQRLRRGRVSPGSCNNSKGGVLMSCQREDCGCSAPPTATANPWSPPVDTWQCPETLLAFTSGKRRCWHHLGRPRRLHSHVPLCAGGRAFPAQRWAALRWRTWLPTPGAFSEVSMGSASPSLKGGRACAAVAVGSCGDSFPGKLNLAPCGFSSPFQTARG